MKPPFIYSALLDDKQRRWAFVAYFLLLIVYVILGFVYVFKAYKSFGNITMDYFMLLENWRQPTIMDITLAPTSSSCPNGVALSMDVIACLLI